MKRFAPYILWFVAGAVLGVVVNNLLGALWLQLGWRQPVADWLVASGLPTLAGYWGLIWLDLPNWLAVAIVGICGGIFIRRHPFISLLIFSIGFVTMPTVVAMIARFSPAAFDSSVWFRVAMWNCIGIVLILAFGLLGFRFRVHEKHAA